MPKLKLTKKVVEQLSVIEKEIKYFDTETNGFFVRVHPSGRKTFGYRYAVMGRKTEKSLGASSNLSLSQARTMAKDQLAQIRTDPENFRENRRVKTKVIIDDYIKRCEVRLRSSSIDQMETFARIYVKPEIGEIEIGKLRTSHLTKLLDKIAALGKLPTSRAVRRFLIGFFKYSVKNDYVSKNYAINTEPHGKPEVKDRYLEIHEIKALFKVLKSPESKISEDVRDCIELMLATGARSSEVIDMDWAELDLDKGEWLLPSKRNKAKRDFMIFLSPRIINILKFRKKKVSGKVFCLSKKSVTQCLKRLSSGKSRVKEKFEGVFTAHDLRRTCATHMAQEFGLEEFILRKILNHGSPGNSSIKHYNKYRYEKEKRDAWGRWCEFLDEIEKSLKD